MATTSLLLTLPPELLLRISTHLTTPQLGDFRRSCKQVEAALFDSFAREFFTKRQFMLEHVSLQALVEIANHPTLSQRLSEVIISSHTTSHNGSTYATLTSRCYYEAGYVNRDVLIQTGQARDMLVEAFSKLPNLRTVGLRDYSGQGRFRDGDHAKWKSYGWSFGAGTIAGVTSHRDSHIHMDSPDTIFPVLLYALGHAKSTPQRLDVFLRRHEKLKPASFSVVDGYMGRAIKPVLANLKTLMLTISCGDGLFFDPSATASHGDIVFRPLKRFLLHTPNLEVLRLNFDTQETFAEPFLQWFGRPAPPSSTTVDAQTVDMPSAALSKLKTFDLGMLTVSAPTLVSILTKFGLRSTSLWKVTLLCKDTAELTEDPNIWSKCFGSLAGALPASTRLNHVLVGFPTQCCIDTIDSRLSSLRTRFAKDGNPENKKQENLEDKIEFKGGYGSNVKQWLNDQAGRTCSPDVLSDSSDTSDEEDEGDESDEASDSDSDSDDVDDGEEVDEDA